MIFPIFLHMYIGWVGHKAIIEMVLSLYFSKIYSNL